MVQTRRAVLPAIPLRALPPAAEAGATEFAWRDCYSRAMAGILARRPWPSIVVILGSCLVGAGARGDALWSLDVFGGAAYNVPSGLTIEQDGREDLHFRAHFETRAFERPLYYALRLGRWADGRSWEIELMHHKLFLRDPPAAVQHFEVTHGFNFIFLNRGLRRTHLDWRFGGGVVVAHPEATIRGQTADSRYSLAGSVTQVTAARRWGLAAGLGMTLEAKFIAAYARLSMPSGRATLTQVGLHALLGLGYAF